MFSKVNTKIVKNLPLSESKVFDKVKYHIEEEDRGKAAIYRVKTILEFFKFKKQLTEEGEQELKQGIYEDSILTADMFTKEAGKFLFKYINKLIATDNKELKATLNKLWTEFTTKATNEATKLPGGATTEEEKSNQDIVKKAESKIKTALNKALKEFFNADKNTKVDNDLKDYNWRIKMTVAPTVWKFDYNSCNIPAVYLDYSKNKDIDHDSILFFEEDFVKWFKKSGNDLNKFFYLSVEDYPGIFIESKKQIKEAVNIEPINIRESVIIEAKIDTLKNKASSVKAFSPKFNDKKSFKSSPDEKDNRVSGLKSIDIGNDLYESNSKVAGCKVKMKIPMQFTTDSSFINNANIIIELADRHYEEIYKTVFSYLTKWPEDAITEEACAIKCKDALLDIFVDDNGFYAFRLKLLFTSSIKGYEKVIAGICVNSNTRKIDIRYWDKWPLDSLKESALLEAKFNKVINGITYNTTYRRNGKTYTYRPLNKQELSKIKAVKTIVVNALKEFGKSDDFKRIISEMKDERPRVIGADKLNPSILYENIDVTVQEFSSNVVADIFVYADSINQDMAYFKDSKGKIFASYTDEVIRGIKGELKSKYKVETYEGDDFYGYTFYLPLYPISELDDNLVEVNESTSIVDTGLFALEEAATSSYKVGDKISVKFNGKEFKPEITSSYKEDDLNKVLSKINQCITVFNGKALWSYFAKHYKNQLENFDYWEDKTIDGASLKKNILSVDYIHIDKHGDIVFVGSCEDDEEHGYEVVFPKGKFIKSSSDSYNKETDEPGWKPACTLYNAGSNYYFQH